MLSSVYDSPFTYFGNKKRVAETIWKHLGEVDYYYEPFFGTGGVYFSYPYPGWPKSVIINDLDGMVANFWRSLKFDHVEVAKWCDCTINEIEVHSRILHTAEHFTAIVDKMVADPTFFDPKMAGIWASAVTGKITPKTCFDGPWMIDPVTRLVTRGEANSGVQLSKPNFFKKNCMRWSRDGYLCERLAHLHFALRDAIVLCGDWSRCFVDFLLDENQITGIFLDPPYDMGKNQMAAVYRNCELSNESLHEFLIKMGAKTHVRIAVCGYRGEYDYLANEHGWTEHCWVTNGGFSAGAKTDSPGKANSQREVIWFSPHCQGSKLSRQPLF